METIGVILKKLPARTGQKHLKKRLVEREVADIQQVLTKSQHLLPNLIFHNLDGQKYL